jgi:hypothetical protein
MGDLENPNDSKENYAAEVESEIKQANSIDDAHCREQRNVSAMPNVSRLILPTRKAKRQVERLLVTVNGVETGRNNKIK